MWYISELQIRAFKSVSSSWVRASFSRGNTVVIGKNGCGKSNLLLALAFASGAGPAQLGVRHLSDLRCIDSDEICEVVLRLSNNLNSQKHQIGAKLTQEGNREFRIDNVKRTLKDVKMLASVIGDASGYTRWIEEQATAVKELQITRNALQDIERIISTMQMSIAEDDVASADAGRLDTLHHQNVQLKDDLRQCLMTQFCSTKQQMEQAESTLCNHQVHASRPERY
ncbi:hypothetical protein WJX84_002372 [Apatococcus fuscideae]|uniref:RecF/RecN/SMC N-terminal domain-containing protein n=1 Tax=Apatococcus fuscideae TaxID=2026836 RepID=A0AAW1SRC0_9CHLO